jgi:hypothetical protein
MSDFFFVIGLMLGMIAVVILTFWFLEGPRTPPSEW